MKSVPLTKTVTSWDGRPIIVDGKLLTVKELLLQYVGTFSSDNGRELILARKVGQKIFDSEENIIKIDDSEFAIINKSTQQPKHIAIVMGFLLEVIEDIQTDKFLEWGGESFNKPEELIKKPGMH